MVGMALGLLQKCGLWGMKGHHMNVGSNATGGENLRGEVCSGRWNTHVGKFCHICRLGSEGAPFEGALTFSSANRFNTTTHAGRRYSCQLWLCLSPPPDRTGMSALLSIRSTKVAAAHFDWPLFRVN
jgi:hypothetical protein